MKKVLFYGLVCLALIILAPFLIIATFSYLGYNDLKNAEKNFTKADFKKAVGLSENAGKKFLISRQVFNLLNPVLVLVLPKETGDGLVNFLKGLENTSSGAVFLGKAFVSLQKTTTNLFSEKAYEKNDLAMAAIEISEAKKSFELANIDFSSQSVDKIPFQKTETKILREQLIQLINNIDQMGAILKTMPRIIPAEEKRSYLILLQNNMELRPTGGFIGSFVVLTLDKGKITEPVVFDVYDADGQLRGHVEPPMPIRKYLPQVNWFLRDSNWEADFPKSAEKAAWFLDKEIGISVDGVLAIDVSFVQLLLRKMGSLYLTDYQEEVTADNLFAKTHLYTNKDFFPGSRQKKSFLSNLMQTLLDKMKTQSVAGEVFTALREAAETKHLQLYFFDPSVQPVFTVNNWAGTLADKRIIKENIVNDFLAIREANLGVNKTNFFLTRSIDQTVNIEEDGSINEVVTINYVNNSPKDQHGFGGSYKNYLRVYLPPKTSITNIAVDGKEMETVEAEQNPLVYEKNDFAKKVARKLEIEQGKESGLLMTGFLVEVPIQSQKTVSIRYQLPQKISPKETTDYDLFVSKQAGTEADPYVLTVSHPSLFSAKTNIQEVVAGSSDHGGNRLTIFSDLTRDRHFPIELLPNE